MDEYISRGKAIKELREVYENEYPTASGDFDEYASHDVPNVLRNIPATDVISSAKVKDLQSQIADLKRCIKSLNSDYLTGYISALSAVERMIIKMLGE